MDPAVYSRSILALLPFAALRSSNISLRVSFAEVLMVFENSSLLAGIPGAGLAPPQPTRYPDTPATASRNNTRTDFASCIERFALVSTLGKGNAANAAHDEER